METNSRSLKSWYRGFKAQHLLAYLLDLGIWLAFLLLIERVLEQYFVFQKQSTPTLLLLIGLALLADRLMSLWSFQHVWRFVKTSDPDFSGKVASDLLQNKGHIPNQEFHQQAIEEFRKTNSLPSYPWSSTALRQTLRSLIWIIGIFPIIAIDQYQPPKPVSHQIVIKVTPPDYLSKEPQILAPGEKDIQIFPGTLVSISIPKILNIHKIQDQRGRLYLPRQSKQSIEFDIRVMGNAQFSTAKSDLLTVTTLTDESPIVEWIDPPKELEFAELECQFVASDDFGLKETLITVNGTELEYAGDPLGKQVFDYRWNFDPQEHLPLMGGNIKLQITAYDNDTIQGPKLTRSKALVWEFPGIEAITKDSIQKLDQLIKDNNDRLSQSKGNLSPEALEKEMQKVAESMENNPALSDDINPIMDQLLDDYKDIVNQPKPSPKTPGLKLGEEDQLERNEDYYKFFKSALNDILQTIQKAEMVSNLMEAAEKSRNGETPDVEFFKKMFDKLSEMTSDGSLSPQQGKDMMDKINQADIAASLGEKEMAAKILEDLAEDLRESQQSPSSDNPLAQKFQELMEQLKSLISNQDSLLSELKQAKQASANLNQSWRQKIQEQKNKTAQTEAFKGYQDFNQQFKNPNLSKEERKSLMSKLGDPNELAFQGRRLTELMRRMDSLSSKPDQKDKIKPQLEALNSTLPDNLKWPEELFNPPQNLTKKDLETLSSKQQNFAPEGEAFSKDFRSSLSPVLPSEGIFRLADQAAQAAKQAGRELLQQSDRAQMNMQGAQQRWQTLQRLLQQMQQQGQGQGSGGQGQPKLSIGKDGKLQLQSENMLGDKEGDGQFRHKKEDMDIPLPDEFQHTKNIEERLKKELLSAPAGEQRDQFQEYLLDLLE